MTRLTVFGTGCIRCHELAHRTEQAALEAGLDFELERIDNLIEIVACGVTETPALAVDGEVRVTGRVPTPEEIQELLAVPA